MFRRDNVRLSACLVTLELYPIKIGSFVHTMGLDFALVEGEVASLCHMRTRSLMRWIRACGSCWSHESQVPQFHPKVGKL